MSQWGEVLAAAELEYADRMRREAADNFHQMQQDAHDELTEWDHYNQHGTHFFSGEKSMKGHPNAHMPEFTGNWAHEELKGYGSRLLKQRAGEYRTALEGMASEGPHGVNEDGLPHHQALENAHNNLRIELQHNNRFMVPHIDSLSPVSHPDEAHAEGALVNPRYNYGTGENSPAGQAAAKINCQRAVLAAEARHRGYNVEARLNYQAPRGGSSNDKGFSDHEIAGFWQNKDGSHPHYQDAEDEFPFASNHEEYWNALTDHIANNWGPGARGVVSPTYYNPGGGTSRHIIGVKVHPQTGQVNYYDPQSGEGDVHDEWLHAPVAHDDETIKGNKIGRNTLRQHVQTKGAEVRTPEDFNYSHSALRFMRTDDKELHPNVSRYMVDRGTAPDMPIYPVNDHPA